MPHSSPDAMLHDAPLYAYQPQRLFRNTAVMCMTPTIWHALLQRVDPWGHGVWTHQRRRVSGLSCAPLHWYVQYCHQPRVASDLPGPFKSFEFRSFHRHPLSLLTIRLLSRTTDYRPTTTAIPWESYFSSLGTQPIGTWQNPLKCRNNWVRVYPVVCSPCDVGSKLILIGLADMDMATVRRDDSQVHERCATGRAPSTGHEVQSWFSRFKDGPDRYNGKCGEPASPHRLP